MRVGATSAGRRSIPQAVDLVDPPAFGDRPQPLPAMRLAGVVASDQRQPAQEPEVAVDPDAVDDEALEGVALPAVVVDRRNASSVEPREQDPPPVDPFESGGGAALRNLPPQDLAEFGVHHAQGEQ